MKRSPSSSLPLNKAIIGFLNYKTAEGLTDRSRAFGRGVAVPSEDHDGVAAISVNDTG